MAVRSLYTGCTQARPPTRRYRHADLAGAYTLFVLPQGKEQIDTEDKASDTITKHNLFFFGIISLGVAIFAFFACESMLPPRVYPSATTLLASVTNLDAQGRL
jgi:hypothetical protein